MPTRREFLSSATLALLTIPLAECSSHKAKQNSASVVAAGVPDDASTIEPDAAVGPAPVDAAAEATADAAGDGEAGPCNGAFDTSTAVPDSQMGDQLHTHTVCVPAGDIGTPPPSGNTYTTSTTLGHAHTVTISQDELTNLGTSGEVVTVTSSTVLDHEHVFIFMT
jgi:hypothetical protein